MVSAEKGKKWKIEFYKKMMGPLRWINTNKPIISHYGDFP